MAEAARKIFIDSSILIAFAYKSNSNHQKASKAIEDMASLGCRLYTSYQVIIDSYLLLSQDANINLSLEFLQIILQSEIEILFPQKSDLITVQRILKVKRGVRISLNEAINATLMQKKGIFQILTFLRWNNLFGTYKSSLTPV